MVEIDDRLSKKFHQQMDGVYAQDEEERLCLVAQSYSICENSIAVLSNLRTDKSHIFFGKSCEILGLGKSNTTQTVDSVWEEDIFNRIHPKNGEYHYWRHRIFYFSGSGQQGISYALCLYNLTPEDSGGAYLINTMTGEKKLLVIDENHILSEREKFILQMIQNGKSSKMIADRLEISKHTVDRHRQNI